MTKDEAKAIALRWIDEATVNGRATGREEVADFRDRMDYLIEGVLHALAAVFPLNGVATMVHYPPRNLLGICPWTKRYGSNEECILRADGAKSAYLEVCGRASVRFPDGHVVTVTEADRFVPVRGKLSGGNGVVVKGELPFLVRNAALYELRVENELEIPAFASFVEYPLPEDLRRVVRVVREHGGQSEDFSGYRCEDGRHLRLPYGVNGEFRLCYERRPAGVPCDAEGDTVLDCHPMAETLIPLKLAADVTMGTLDRAETAAFLESRYSAMVMTLRTEQPDTVKGIEPVYGAG